VTKFNPQNILVIDFGQLGDVVLSLPALRAIREKFPLAKITVAAGKSCTAVIEMSGYANETISVDRVALRDGVKILSIGRIVNLVKEVRRREFDFVIDLHSLSETNVLGWLSGAEKRLYSRRPGRSLDYLSNFRPRAATEDTTRHATDRYLEVLAPLGIKNAPREPVLTPTAADLETAGKFLRKHKADAGVPLIGLFPGAGHPSRRWALERFSTLADLLIRNDGVRVLVFLGPEEDELRKQVAKEFPREVITVERLSLPQLAAMLARLAVLVSNDTGPMHIAAAVGTPVVKLIGHPTLNTYVPIGEHHSVIHGANIDAISVEEVYAITHAKLARGRTASIFSR
jgi:ADP-heptose:LPS heptosyltransferase